MKAYLMYPDQDFDVSAPLRKNAKDLYQDLELGVILDAMAGGDEFLRDIAGRALLGILKTPQAIEYRQQILIDCLEQPAVIRQLYALAVEAIEAEKHVYHSIFSNYPSSVLRTSMESLKILVKVLGKLRQVADDNATSFRSPGFTRFFGMLADQLDDEYFSTIAGHLKTLEFRNGVLISAGLGKANQGTNFTLSRPDTTQQNWLERLFNQDRSTLTFQISDRDESGFRALSELKDRGINLVANALAQADDHILSFFSLLRAELGFYMGALNLRDRLNSKGQQICLPKPEAMTPELCLSLCGLCDASLVLTSSRQVVGNDVGGDGKALVMVTGANEGGKSTFLRSVGLAQLMMQAGLFVVATYYSSSVCDGIFTHYKREEDTSLVSGKLDEELARMSAIADAITPNCMLLFNESFAATNEREGSGIARDIILALLESRMRVFFVTHLYDLACGLYGLGLPEALFLQAERREDGKRTFKLIAGEPTATSYGEDLYRQIFTLEVPERVQRA